MKDDRQKDINTARNNEGWKKDVEKDERHKDINSTGRKKE